MHGRAVPLWEVDLLLQKAGPPIFAYIHRPVGFLAVLGRQHLQLPLAARAHHQIIVPVEKSIAS